VQNLENRHTTVLAVIAAIFTGSLVIAAVLAAKLIEIGPFVVPAGVLAFSLTFLCTDIISETYGKATAHRVVLGGFIALVVSLLLIRFALVLPSPPFWEHQNEFATILSSSERIILASLVAYVISQNADVWLFSRLRKATNGKNLWIRNNASTVISQLLDSVVFVAIAFYGQFPIFEIILGQWVIKMGIAVLDTPLVYLGVWFVNRTKGQTPEEPQTTVA
jgi:queuosine precursor transporter